MAQVRLRVNFGSAIFPFYTQAAGRTIITPDQDENYDRYNAANTSPDKGVPQVYYMHNVFPIAGGFQSIGYETILPAFSPIGGGANPANFDQIFNLQSSDNSRILFSPAAGSNYIYDGQVGSWLSVNPIDSLAVTADTMVTTAFVNDQSYFNYSLYGTFYYDTDSQTIKQVVLASLNDETVKGITAANGYMIAWTDNTIAWSSLVNPLDFLPSIQTGAGGGQIQQAKGKINFCLPISGGFLLYCDNNVVAASYTNNTAYPYIFTEVAGSGGCFNPDQVGYQSNLNSHFAYTTSGLQQLNMSSAQAVLPEVDDFFGSQLYEDFNESTLTLSTTYLSRQVFVKIATISNRWVILSYGQNDGEYTYAIVYDLTLNRYGKVKIPHVASFPYNYPNAYLGETYNQQLATGVLYNAVTETYDQEQSDNSVILQKTTLAFLQNTGEVQLVNFDLSEATADGIFILGKYQIQRNAFITHQTTDIENIIPGNTFSLYALPTLDGKDLLAPVALTEINTAVNTNNRTFAGRVTGLNMSFLFVGSFNLTSGIVSFTAGGYR